MTDREQTQPGTATQLSVSNANTTMDKTSDSFLLNVKRDEHTWIVSEHDTAVWGAGPTLLEALSDFYIALRSHLTIMDKDTISPHLQRQKQRILWMLEHADG